MDVDTTRFNVTMARTYNRYYGFDWPKEMSEEFVGLVIGKKWREYAAQGIEFKDPWVPMMNSMKKLYGDEYFRVSEWTEQHVHDWVMEPFLVVIGCASSGKSNDIGGALTVVDWVTDPYDTVTLIGSTTKDALRYRSWESVERYFGVLKSNSTFFVPGKITQTGYAVVNDRDVTDDPLAQGAKAGIHGVALNDGGKLQGAHLPYVRLVVDELATIFNHQDILTTIENLQITKDFKFVGLANPETWSNPSCQYIIPEGGPESVTVDTGSWRSTFGCFVRHHDGLKSPCVKDPSLAEKFPFLVTKRHIESALKRTGGNADAPHFWKMVRGFPMPAGNDGNTVLDEAIAVRNHVEDPTPEFQPGMWVDTAAGVDPAWTQKGDNACYARCWVRRDMWGRPYLDFTNGIRKMSIDASKVREHPAVEQMRTQVLAFMREPYAARFATTAVDSSGNQGLADDLVIYAAATDILSVNFAVRASEASLRAADLHKAKEVVYDRGTEAWCVLAEFCRAGQVKGLPHKVVEQLCDRRFAANMVKDAAGMKRPAGVKTPLRLEDKEEYKKRHHGESPDECDACALAALAVKERIGLIPFGYVIPPRKSDGTSPWDAAPPPKKPAIQDDYEDRPDDYGEFMEREV